MRWPHKWAVSEACSLKIPAPLHKPGNYVCFRFQVLFLFWQKCCLSQICYTEDRYAVAIVSAQEEQIRGKSCDGKLVNFFPFLIIFIFAHFFGNFKKFQFFYLFLVCNSNKTKYMYVVYLCITRYSILTMHCKIHKEIAGEI